ncbi:hypothetical protein RIF29_25325 [Crotalaria pallida]|uniref:Uncharacterized protein n=1 Tax=Crotalaria pallida TaxID=3830 RepID=A0AAN9ELD6_CROPI
MFGHDKKMCRKDTRKEWVVKKKPTQEEVLEIHEEAKAKEIEKAYKEACATPKKNSDAVIVVQSRNAENPKQNDGASDDNVAESQNGNQWQMVVTRQRAKGKAVDGYEMFKFSTKLKKVKRVLLQLNRDRFNSIDKKEAALKCQLDEAQRNLQLDPGNINLQQAERDIYLEYRKTFQQALSFMRQKAKEKWIQDGDQNTSFFFIKQLREGFTETGY